MNLGPRCEQIMENHCQCPNTAVKGSDYCLLHTKEVRAVDTTPTNIDKEISKQTN